MSNPKQSPWWLDPVILIGGTIGLGVVGVAICYPAQGMSILAAIGGWLWKGLKNPDWVSAIATVAAFIAASIAVHYAKKVYRVEQQRDAVQRQRDVVQRQQEQREHAERMAQQASKVAIWSTKIVSHYHGGGISTGVVSYVLSNRSDLPVTRVKVSGLVAWPGVSLGDGEAVWAVGADREEDLPPSDEPHARQVRLPQEALDVVPMHLLERGIVRLNLRFVDTQGLEWTRSSTGRLSYAQAGESTPDARHS